jgi:hypothetical protein
LIHPGAASAAVNDLLVSNKLSIDGKSMNGGSQASLDENKGISEAFNRKVISGNYHS